jgi:hypothetical protein
METYLGRSLETLGSKLATDAVLAKKFQDNPLETLRGEGIPVVQYYALDPSTLAQGGTSPGSTAEADAAAVHPPSEFVCNTWGAYFYITSEEAKRLTVSRVVELIREAYGRLSSEEQQWVGPKLSGLELGMVVGIEVWKLMGETCGRQRVHSFSMWPRTNSIWTPPLCA